MLTRFLKQASAYISVATLAMLSDWVVFAVVSWLWPQHDVVFVQAYARLTGGLVAFLLHRAWSFKDQEGLGLATEAGRFMALYVFSFCVSLSTIFLLVDVFDANRYPSKLFADLLCFVVNFFVMKHWVFKAAGGAKRDGLHPAE